MFAVSPLFVANAPAEATMGLVQKVFYLHLPSAWFFLLSAILCGVMSIRYLINGKTRADHTAFAAAELTAFFGLLTLVTGPLWARRSWGAWWVWDVRVTSSLVGWLISLSYLLLRKYGGPGVGKLAASVAIFGMANVPFIYFSVRAWRTIHPTTDVIPKLPTSFGVPLWFSFVAFACLFSLLLRTRIELEDLRSRVDALFLESGE